MTGQSDRSHGAASALPDGATVALPRTLPERPFGVHFRMSRWKSLIVLIAIPVTLLVVQIIVFQAVVMIEGPADPNRPALTPLTIVASGISTAITAVLATILVASMAKVPWRAVFRHRRALRLAPPRHLPPWIRPFWSASASSPAHSSRQRPLDGDTRAFGIGATTIGIIVVTLLAIPLQAAGEEVAFRGAVIPAAGSWFRGTRLAVVFGILVSGALFALVHVSLDPWFVSYLFVFSACAAIMGLISGGLEAAIAFHVSNNVLAGIVNALFAGNDATVVDRAVGSGPGPAFIILMVMNVSVVALVWRVERTKRSRNDLEHHRP